jgi:hypothetical protein
MAGDDPGPAVSERGTCVRSFDEAFAEYRPFGTMSDLDEANARSDHDTYVANAGFMALVRDISGALMSECAAGDESKTGQIVSAWIAGAIHMGIDIGRLMEREPIDATSLLRAETPVQRETPDHPS